MSKVSCWWLSFFVTMQTFGVQAGSPKTISIQGKVQWMNPQTIKQLLEQLNKKGFRKTQGTKSSYHLHVVKPHVILLRKGHWRRYFRIPTGYKTATLRIRAIVSYIEVFDEWQATKEIVQSTTNTKKTPQNKKQATNTKHRNIRIPKQKTNTKHRNIRKTKQKTNTKHRNIRKTKQERIGALLKIGHPKEHWRLFLGIGAELGMQSTFGRDMMLGGVAHLGTVFKQWMFQGELSFLPLFFQDVVSLHSIRFCLASHYRFLRPHRLVSLFLEAGAVFEGFLATNRQNTRFQVRVGIRPGIRIRFQLSSRVSLFSSFACNLFATQFFLERRGEVFYETSWWQFHLRVGLSVSL